MVFRRNLPMFASIIRAIRVRPKRRTGFTRIQSATSHMTVIFTVLFGLLTSELHGLGSSSRSLWYLCLAGRSSISMESEGLSPCSGVRHCSMYPARRIQFNTHTHTRVLRPGSIAATYLSISLPTDLFHESLL